MINRNTLQTFFCGLFIISLTFSACRPRNTDRQAIQNQVAIRSWDEGMQDIVNLIDSVSSEQDSLVINEPKLYPEQVDTYFEDFIYQFGVDSDFQLRRIIFPLPIYRGDSIIYYQKDAWKHDSLVSHLPYYSMIFDDRAEYSMMQDSTIRLIHLDYYDSKHQYCRSYYFKKIQGLWLLEAMHYPKHIKGQTEDTRLGSFLDFWMAFASDTIFQQQHIQRTVEVETANPDNEFETIKGTFDHQQWPLFRPSLDGNVLTNIDVGQHLVSTSYTRTVVLDGASNGLFIVLRFRYDSKKKTWLLYGLEEPAT
ncbi:MAG TPA: DUF4348 domain-containing protein [Bacteroidaceae bacterium]|nr:DUF4348 domain-containing protein [Bacteroidaceae bacterium]